MTATNTLKTTATWVAAAICMGCATTETSQTQGQRQSLVRAEAQLEEAEQAGAYEQAGAELAGARDKLAQARLAAQEGEVARADRLAQEAELDAQLASAIASNQEMQNAVEELNATIDTLREELRRSQ